MNSGTRKSLLILQYRVPDLLTSLNNVCLGEHVDQLPQILSIIGRIGLELYKMSHLTEFWKFRKLIFHTFRIKDNSSMVGSRDSKFVVSRKSRFR